MTYMALIYGPPMPASMTLSPEAVKAWMDYTQAARDAGVFLDGAQTARSVRKCHGIAELRFLPSIGPIWA